MKKSFRSLLSLSAIVLAASLTACGQETPAPAASTPAAAKGADAIPESQPVSVAAIKTHARGFTAGSLMSARQVYVFFDAQCPHCATLWESSKALHGQAGFTWIPTVLLSKASRTQGAVLLTAPDGAATMNEHEKLLSSKQGGISAPSDVPADIDAALKANTKLLMSFGAESVPFVVTQDPATGEVISFAGSMPSDVLAAKLKLTAAPATVQ